MKPITTVALRMDCALPLELIDTDLMETPSGQLALLKCTAVQETAFGFVRLVAKQPRTHELALTVPPHAIAWMLQVEKPSELGFLSAPG